MKTASKPVYINLLARNNERSKIIAPVMVVCFLLIILTVMMGYFYRLTQKELITLRILNSELKSQISIYKGEQDGLNSQLDRQNKLVAREKMVNSMQRQKISCVGLLEEITKALPAPVKMADIEIGQEKLILNGYAPQHQDIASFLSRLSRSPVFKEIKLALSTVNEDNNQVMFTIEIAWEADQK